MMQKITEFWHAHRKLSIFLLVVVILGGIFLFIRSRSSGQVQYQTAAVEKGSIVSSVSASGKVIVANSFSISTQATGVVKDVFVKDGDHVFSGQKIAEIELDSDSAQRNAQAWASYLSAKNNLDSANVSLYSLQSQEFAANQKFINDAVHRSLTTDDPTYIQENADWLAAEAKYQNQVSVINQSKAALTSAWLSYQVTSPIISAQTSGTIDSIGITPGMVLQGSSSTTVSNSQRVAVIQNSLTPIISVDLAEIDVPKIKINQKATIIFDSLPDKTFTGKVTTIDRVGNVSSNVTSYPATIKLDTDSDQLLPNMAGTANIVINSKNDVLLVPSTAVQNQNGQMTVRELKNGQVVNIPVETGLTSDTQTEIISGVNEGESVVTGIINSASTNTNRTSVFGGGNFGAGALRTGGGFNNRTGR